MAIKFRCQNPQCRKGVVAPDSAAGKNARCPYCNHIQVVPPPQEMPEATPYEFADEVSQPPGVPAPGPPAWQDRPVATPPPVAGAPPPAYRPPGMLRPRRRARGELPPWALFLVILVPMVGLFLLAQANKDFAPVFSLLQGLVGLVVGICTLVSAFHSSAGQGFATLCIPCYALYYVYGVCENSYLKWAFGANLIASVLSVIAEAESGAAAGSGIY